MVRLPPLAFRKGDEDHTITPLPPSKTYLIRVFSYAVGQHILVRWFSELSNVSSEVLAHRGSGGVPSLLTSIMEILCRYEFALMGEMLLQTGVSMKNGRWSEEKGAEYQRFLVSSSVLETCV